MVRSVVAPVPVRQPDFRRGTVASGPWRSRCPSIGTAMPRSDDATDMTYYDNGQVKHRGAIVGGEMDGPWEWFRRDGSLMRAGSFDHGRQVGMWRTFARDGRVVKETRFRSSGQAASGRSHERPSGAVPSSAEAGTP